MSGLSYNFFTFFKKIELANPGFTESGGKVIEILSARENVFPSFSACDFSSLNNRNKI